MARMRFNQSDGTLNVAVRQSPAFVAANALFLAVTLALAVALTSTVVSLVLQYGGLPSLGGSLLIAAAVLSLWSGVASAVWTLGTSHVIVLSRRELTVTRRWAAFPGRRRESSLGEDALFEVPALPSFFSLALSPSETVVLSDGTAVGIDRSVVGRRDANDLAARFNAFLGA